MITDYNSFVTELLNDGFSMGGGNSEGIFSIIPWSWDQEPPYETPVRWHTGDPETDPWEWRMRVLDERTDIAYAKVFFRKSGYITRDWYPDFLAVRRKAASFEAAYADGTISFAAKRIYEQVREHGTLPLHAIKVLGGFKKEDASAFDRGLTELQMRMFLTMCGRQQKISQQGAEYGWSSTVFCTPETFFGESVLEEARQISEKEASFRIAGQIEILNPGADPKKIAKFIRG